MQHGTRENTKQFNDHMVDRYYNGESVASISKSTGRSVSTVSKLVAAERALNPDRPRLKAARDPRALVEKKVISPRHSWIGLHIARYRAERELTPTAFGMLLPSTAMVIRNMEIGAHDFSITEIERLSSILEVSFEDLISGGQFRK